MAFSATYTPDILREATAIMNNPQPVLLCPQTTALHGALFDQTAHAAVRTYPCRMTERRERSFAQVSGSSTTSLGPMQRRAQINHCCGDLSTIFCSSWALHDPSHLRSRDVRVPAPRAATLPQAGGSVKALRLRSLLSLLDRIAFDQVTAAPPLCLRTCSRLTACSAAHRSIVGPRAAAAGDRVHERQGLGGGGGADHHGQGAPGCVSFR